MAADRIIALLPRLVAFGVAGLVGLMLGFAADFGVEQKLPIGGLVVSCGSYGTPVASTPYGAVVEDRVVEYAGRFEFGYRESENQLGTLVVIQDRTAGVEVLLYTDCVAAGPYRQAAEAPDGTPRAAD